MTKQTKNLSFKQERTRVYDDKKRATYRETKKYPRPTICTECGALFTNGRWSWDDIPEETSQAVCPACQRIRDNYPCGIIEVSGTFFKEHRTELINMIRNIAKKETSEHPLERLIHVQDEKDKTIVTTTGSHIARRVGDTLFHTYEGELSYNYDDDNLIRVYWHR